MNQKDAVFSAITTVFSNNNVSFVSGTDNANNLLNKQLRSEVTNIVAGQIRSGEVEMSQEARSKNAEDSALRSYVSSLITNWLRKDNRLNGGSSPVKSSKRIVHTDSQLKALRQLLAAQTDQAKRLEIQTHIDQRLSQLSQ